MRHLQGLVMVLKNIKNTEKIAVAVRWNLTQTGFDDLATPYAVRIDVATIIKRHQPAILNPPTTRINLRRPAVRQRGKAALIVLMKNGEIMLLAIPIKDGHHSQRITRQLNLDPLRVQRSAFPASAHQGFQIECENSDSALPRWHHYRRKLENRQ